MSKLEEALWQAFDGSLAVSDVAKHANHDQKDHGNWARTGSATPKEMREEFDGRLPMLDGYRNRTGLASATEYGTPNTTKSFYFGSLPTVDSYSGRLILGKNSTAQQEWEDGYLDDGRIRVDGISSLVRNAGWWTNMGAWHQRMLSAAILGLEVPEAISYELVSGWSPLTAELVITGELTGEAVDAHMDYDYGEGNYTDANRNQEIEAAEWFVADQLQRAWKALAAAGENPPIDYKLYRVVQNLNPDSELMNLKPGDTYHAPLGSYSAYTGMANDFLNRGADDERPEVVITVKPGARGATYDGIGRGEFSGGGLPDEIGGPLEAVIAGKFQVTEVRVATDGTRHIEVAQVEYPDVTTKFSEEKLTFFTASDTQSEQSRQEIKNNLPRDADGDGIIFEGTPRERFTPLVAPVEKAEGRPRVPAWFFDDFAPAERHSDDALSKHAEHDQKDHGKWARGGGVPGGSVVDGYWVPGPPPPGFNERGRKDWKRGLELFEERPELFRAKVLADDGLPVPEGEEPSYAPGAYDELSDFDDKSALMTIGRAINQAWEDEITRAIALNKIDPGNPEELFGNVLVDNRSEAFERYGYDAKPERGTWKELPDQLFHVTTNLGALQESGFKTRDQLVDEAGNNPAGLGGGVSNAISFTTDPPIVDAIVRGIHEMREVVRDDTGPAAVERMKAEIASWDTADERDGRTGLSGAQRLLAENPSNMEERGGFYKDYSYWRQFNVPNRPDPLFFSPNYQAFSDIDPAQIGVVTISPSVAGAKGWQVEGLGEWRTIPEAVEVVAAEARDADGDGIIFEGTDQERFVGKHAEHDQKSHGNWDAAYLIDEPS